MHKPGVLQADSRARAKALRQEEGGSRMFTPQNGADFGVLRSSELPRADHNLRWRLELADGTRVKNNGLNFQDSSGRSVCLPNAISPLRALAQCLACGLHLDTRS